METSSTNRERVVLFGDNDVIMTLRRWWGRNSFRLVRITFTDGISCCGYQLKIVYRPATLIVFFYWRQIDRHHQWLALLLSIWPGLIKIGYAVHEEYLGDKSGNMRIYANMLITFLRTRNPNGIEETRDDDVQDQRYTNILLCADWFQEHNAIGWKWKEG